MDNYISSGIDVINKKIEELESQKAVLKNLETSGLSDAEKWCVLRDSPLRTNKEAMLGFAEKFIPGADEYSFGPNAVSVRMGHIYVSLPTCRSFNLEVSYMGRLIRSYPDPVGPSATETYLLEYIKLLESKASRWKLSKVVNPNLGFFKRSFTFLSMTRNRDVEYFKKKYNEMKTKREESNRRNLESYNILQNEVSRFDALMYDKVKAFAGDKFKIRRNNLPLF